MDESLITQVATALHPASRVVVLTGAGVSAESGVPTFRDAQTGLWSNFDPDELATPMAFRRNPKLVWDFYEGRRQQLANVTPNPGHYAIAALEEMFPSVIVVTQNIDGLHRVAGSSDVIELHGNLRQHKCFADCQGKPTLIDIATLADWDPASGPPHCPHCGDYLRPDVVWFEELLPQEALERASASCRAADAILVVGTSGEVYPAASLPSIARRAVRIEVNPNPTPQSSQMRYCLRGPSGEVLPALVAALRAMDTTAA